MFLIFIDFIHLSILGFLIVYIKKKQSNPSLVSFFYPAVCLKILAGAVLGLVYKNYYLGGDTLNFFNDASQLANLAYEDFNAYCLLVFFDTYTHLPELSDVTITYQPRAFLMIKLMSFFNLITFNDYWLIGFYFSFFSFYGIWHLVDRLARYFPDTSYAACISLLFVPSIIFWSAGVNKESLAMPAICMLIAFFLDFIHTKKIKPAAFVLSIFFIVLLATIKFYYLAILLPSILAYISIFFLKEARPVFFKNTALQIIFFLLVFTLVIYGFSFSDEKLNTQHILEALVVNHNVSYKASELGEAIQYYKINQRGYFALYSKPESILFNSPLALLSGLYRPFLWEAHSTMSRFVGFENLLILLGSFYTLVYYGIHRVKIKNPLLIFALLTYICLLATVLAIASPNFGSLVRYKVAFLPFFIYLILIPFNSYCKHLHQFLLKIFSRWLNPKNI